MDSIIKIHYLKNFNQKLVNWCNTKKCHLLHAIAKKANVSNYTVNVLQIIGYDFKLYRYAHKIVIVANAKIGLITLMKDQRLLRKLY